MVAQCGLERGSFASSDPGLVRLTPERPCRNKHGDNSISVRRVFGPGGPRPVAMTRSRLCEQGISMTQWVYTFGDGKAEGRAEMKNLLGGKGANLAEMSNLGLPVPPGFTITTEL